MLDGVAVTCHAAFSLTCTVLVGVLGIYFPRLGSSSGLWMEITWSSLESPPNLSLRTRPCSGSARNPVPCSGRDVSRCGGPCRAVAVDSDPARSCPPRRPGAPDGRTAACVPLQPQGVWPAGLPPVRSPFALAPSPWETNLCHLRQVAEEGGTQIANAAPGHLLGRLVPGQPRVVPLHSW